MIFHGKEEDKVTGRKFWHVNKMFQDHDLFSKEDSLTESAVWECIIMVQDPLTGGIWPHSTNPLYQTFQNLDIKEF